MLGGTLETIFNKLLSFQMRKNVNHLPRYRVEITCAFWDISLNIYKMAKQPHNSRKAPRLPKHRTNSLLIFLKYLTARFTLLKRETEYNSKVLKTLGLQKADNSYDSDLHLDKERTCETQKVDISEKQKWSSNCSRALVCVHIHSLNVACKIKHSIMSRIKGEVWAVREF